MNNNAEEIVSNDKKKNKDNTAINPGLQEELKALTTPTESFKPTAEESQKICQRIFGNIKFPEYSESHQLEQPAAYDFDADLKYLKIYETDNLRELSDLPSIGKEERRFYASLRPPLLSEKPLREPSEMVLDRVRELFDLFPNAIELLRYVYDFLSLRSISHDKKAIYFPPICIAGPAGIGKTAVIQRICNALTVDYSFYDFSSASSSWGLAGQDSAWNGSHPGQVLKSLVYGGCGNPVIHIDELDKATVNQNQDPYLALHTLFERPQMRNFRDAFAQNLPLNAHYVMFMCTANNIDAIPQTIQSRLRIINMERPSDEQMRKISSNMYTSLLKSESVDGVFVDDLDDEVVDMLASKTPRETGLMLARGLASAASRKPICGRYSISLDDLVNNHDQEIVAKKMGFVW
jgi:hypothetical protein